MQKSQYFLRSLINSAGVFIYVLAVVSLISNAKNIFGDEEGFFVPVFMLLLLIISATTTGLLVLGRPLYLYLNNQKKEAFTLLLFTLAWLVLFLFSVALWLFLR